MLFCRDTDISLQSLKRAIIQYKQAHCCEMVARGSSEKGKKIFIGCENKAISRGFFSDGEPESAGHLLYFTSMGEVARSPTPTWDSDPIFILEVSPDGSEFQEESFRGRQQLRAVQMCSPCV